MSLLGTETLWRSYIFCLMITNLVSEKNSRIWSLNLLYKKPNRILLKETLNLYLNRLPLPDTFDIDGESVSDPIVISNGFCKHYSSIAVHLASNIPESVISYTEFLTGYYPAVKILYSTTESEVRKIISSLTLTRTTGLDGFSNIHLKKLKN